ncbi:MAG: hypothetical protein J2P25_00380 [Nocardiopsaceae bacterium]|nr:hypothetical protein [Nocardiopsaceae bacterium]
MSSQGTRSVIGVAGLALLVVGVVKALFSAGDGGVIALLVVGALLVVSPFALGRVGRLPAIADGLDLHLGRYLGREAGERGGPGTGRLLDRADLARFAESYAFVHEELREPQHLDAKVYLQDLLVQRAAALSRREKLSATEVRALFKDASPMLRVVTIGLMQGDPSLADGATIISAIADSRTANEQFQGLRLALLCWHNLERADRHAIQGAAKDSPHIQPGTDRQSLADQVLALSA